MESFFSQTTRITKLASLPSHWWFSGKIGRCHVKYIFIDVGQPRVRFPADAFFVYDSLLMEGDLSVLLFRRGRRVGDVLGDGEWEPDWRVGSNVDPFGVIGPD
jgi:hypothetical protein